jgi:hypothetical protein
VVGKCSTTRIGCTESEAEEAMVCNYKYRKRGNRAWVPQNLSVLKNSVGKKRQARKATSLCIRKQCLTKKKVKCNEKSGRDDRGSGQLAEMRDASRSDVGLCVIGCFGCTKP